MKLYRAIKGCMKKNKIYINPAIAMPVDNPKRIDFGSNPVMLIEKREVMMPDIAAAIDNL